VGIPTKHPWTQVTANGATVWTQAGGFASGVTGITAGGTDGQYIKFNVAPGTWQFAAQ
jgi:hypothetical protein